MFQWKPTVDANTQTHGANTPTYKTTTGQQNYACAVLNDGMYMLDCWNAIHEGDGYIYFRYVDRKKYALEAYHQLATDSIT